MSVRALTSRAEINELDWGKSYLIWVVEFRKPRLGQLPVEISSNNECVRKASLINQTASSYLPTLYYAFLRALDAFQVSKR